MAADGAPDDTDDEYRTPPPFDVAGAAWKVADRTDRTLERWRTHLFGFKDDKNDKGRLGRLEADMDEHTVTLKEHSARHEKHDRALDRLDRIGFKILVTTGIGAGCAMAIIEIAIRVIGGSH